jgi:hypothetical protein
MKVQKTTASSAVQRTAATRGAPAARSALISPAAAALNLQKTVGNRGVHRLLQDREQAVDWQPLASERGAGAPLAADARGAMERQFGQNLSDVRIHTASPIAEALGAKAFASGRHIWFARAHDPSDRRLLGHEMAHVVEQSGAQRNRVKGTATQFDFEEDVLNELKKLPSSEEEGLPEPERRRREKVILDRRDRLRQKFRQLSAKEAAALHDRLKTRRSGDVLSEKFHDILATATRRGLLDILDEDILEAPPHLADFCQPYTPAELRVLLDLADSRAMHDFVDDWIAIAYGDEAAELYSEYLGRTKDDSLAPKIFDDPSNTIVKAFISDAKTAAHRDYVLNMFEVNLLSKCPSLPEGVWTDVDLGTVVPAGVLNQGFSFSGPTIPTLPGLIAGGISASDAGMDSRSVSGTVQMRRTVVNGRTTSVRLRTKFRFVVRDAIDFCPGDPGSRLAQSFTIPMSRLEASGDAYDLPFEVRYDAPVLERDLNGAVLFTCFGQ